MRHRQLPQIALLIAAIFLIVSSLISFFHFPESNHLIRNGICLPAPDVWLKHNIWSYIANLFGISLTLLIISALNKRYLFIRNADATLQATFLILAASLPWINSTFCTATLLAVANVLGMALMFDVYDQRNATLETFVLGTILSIGTMTQSAFIIFIPAWIIALSCLNVCRWRELIAYVMGLSAPYLTALGLGLISIQSLSWPEYTIGFPYQKGSFSQLVIYLNIGITAIWWFIMTLNTWIKLYAGNKRVQAFNSIINLMGIASVCGILFDLNNISAYITMLYLCTAVQVANLVSLGIAKRPGWIFSATFAVYATLFFFTL